MYTADNTILQSIQKRFQLMDHCIALHIKLAFILDNYYPYHANRKGQFRCIHDYVSHERLRLHMSVFLDSDALGCTSPRYEKVKLERRFISGEKSTRKTQVAHDTQL